MCLSLALALLVPSCGTAGRNKINASATGSPATTTVTRVGAIPAAPAPLPDSTYPNGISPRWLSEAQNAWASAPPSPLLLSPTLNGASYDNIRFSGHSLRVVEKELAMEEDTGSEAITIDLGYDPWLSGDTSIIDDEDALIGSIRSSGRLVVLKDASAERYRNFPLPWDQFAAAWVQRVKAIAARYHPDYYTVIKEPPWYAPMVAGLSRTDYSAPADKQLLDVSTWTSLLRQLITAVKSVSPTTKVGIAVDANLYRGQPGDVVDLKLMSAASRMEGVDFLGFDLYTASSFADTQRFLEDVGTGGKAVWINEAWSTTAPTTSNPDQPEVDARWAGVLLDFAREIHAQGVSPFFTDYFASYSPAPTSESALLSFYQGRTPVFRAFQAYERACRQRRSGSAVSAPC